MAANSKCQLNVYHFYVTSRDNTKWMEFDSPLALQQRIVQNTVRFKALQRTNMSLFHPSDSCEFDSVWISSNFASNGTCFCLWVSGIIYGIHIWDGFRKSKRCCSTWGSICFDQLNEPECRDDWSFFLQVWRALNKICLAQFFRHQVCLQSRPEVSAK